jgi:hypothetical protein
MMEHNYNTNNFSSKIQKPKKNTKNNCITSQKTDTKPTSAHSTNTHSSPHTPLPPTTNLYNITSSLTTQNQTNATIMTSCVFLESREQDSNYRPRGNRKKLLKSYYNPIQPQPKRTIENYTDEQTLLALNHTIYNIETDYIKIGTINVNKEINNKIDQLIDLCIDRSYHLIGLTEIGRTSPASSYNRPKIIKKINSTTDIQQTYYFYEHNQEYSNHAGVGLIISDHMQKHIVKTEAFHNRIISFKLCFKKNINIQIIILYLPANNADYNLSNKCHDTLKQLITKAKTEKSLLIIMEDLNIDVKDIKQRSNQANKNWKAKKSIIKTINFQQLMDITKYYHPENMPTTWTSYSDPNIIKRLDYTYLSPILGQNSFYSFVEQVSELYFKTDHKIVGSIINKEFFLQYRSQAKICNFSQNKTRIMYKTIPDNIKKMFKDRLDDIIIQQPTRQYTVQLQLSTSNSYNQPNLNNMWKHIKNCMNKIKNSDLLKEFRKKPTLLA